MTYASAIKVLLLDQSTTPVCSKLLRLGILLEPVLCKITFLLKTIFQILYHKREMCKLVSLCILLSKQINLFEIWIYCELMLIVLRLLVVHKRQYIFFYCQFKLFSVKCCCWFRFFVLFTFRFFWRSEKTLNNFLVSLRQLKTLDSLGNLETSSIVYQA